jgi:integrase
MAGFKPITLHEARHTFASLMIAAGVNAKALSTYMGIRPSRSRSTATAS